MLHAGIPFGIVVFHVTIVEIPPAFAGGERRDMRQHLRQPGIGGMEGI